MPASGQWCGQQEQQHDREAAEELGIGLEALNDGETRRAFGIQQCFAPLKGVDRVLGLQCAEGLLLDLLGPVDGEVAFVLEHQPDQGANRPAQQVAAAGEQRDLRV